MIRLLFLLSPVLLACPLLNTEWPAASIAILAGCGFVVWQVYGRKRPSP